MPSPSKITTNRCGGCQTIVKGRHLLRCCLCSQCYDLQCANVSEMRFFNTLNKSTWKCPLCKNKEPKVGNIDTPVRPVKTDNASATSNIALTETNTEYVTVRSRNEPKLQMSPDKTPTPADMGQMMADIKNILEELQTVRSEMHEYMSLVSRLTTDIATCNERIDDLSIRVNTLEQREPHESSSALAESITEIKNELNDREQELLLSDIEMSGIPEENNENAVHIILTVAKKLGVALDERDVVCAERVGAVRSAAPGASAARPRPVVVRLARRVLKERMVAAARVRRTLDTSDMGLSDMKKSFHVNERLTKRNRQIFFLAREASVRAKWKFVWSRDGKIFARRESGAARHRLKSEEDIKRVFGQDFVRKYN